MTYPHASHAYPYLGAPHPAWPAHLQHPFAQEVFSVRVHKHSGLLIAWCQQTHTVTGTRAQCAQALRTAQVHNLLAGWWSPLSILLLNWIALICNASESARLRRTAAVHNQRPPTPLTIAPAVYTNPPR